MFSDLFFRGEMDITKPFLICGQLNSSSYNIPGDNTLLNYFLTKNGDNILQLSFSQGGTPLFFTMRLDTTKAKYIIVGGTDPLGGNYEYLCYNPSNQSLFFSLDEQPFYFDFSSPLYNIPLSKIYSGTYYSIPLVTPAITVGDVTTPSYPGVNFFLPSGVTSLQGEGSNGYFCNDSLSSSPILFTNILFGLLPIYFYNSLGNPNSSSSQTFVNYKGWINSPNTYLNPPVSSWIGGSASLINSSPSAITLPMGWYRYCDYTTQCGDCFGSVIIGGVECSPNSQLQPIIPSPGESLPIEGKAFIPSGNSGNQGSMGLRGAMGPTNYSAASGPRGLQGNEGKPGKIVSWNSGMGLVFVTMVIFSLLLIFFIILIVMPKMNLRVPLSTESR